MDRKNNHTKNKRSSSIARSNKVANLIFGMGSVLEIMPPQRKFKIKTKIDLSGELEKDAASIRGDWEKAMDMK